MFSIGDFARHGQVSVRMLRHYDAIGLLRPARVDAATGYRYYRADQLTRLNRLTALKELGFTLHQVGAILDERVSIAELRGMLRLRRAEVAERLAAETARLARVEARLRTLEEGAHHMPAHDVVIKRLPAVRVAELTATAAGFAPEDISPVIAPLYPELERRLTAAGLTPTGPGIAYYTEHRAEAGDRPGNADSREGEGLITVHACLPVAAEPRADHDFAIVDLPEIEAATTVHRGSMDEVMPSAQALAHWIEANGYRSAGYTRELYLDCPADRAQWVVELQEPITRA